MRLTKSQLFIIKESFRKHFVNGDVLWLFGSRADDSQRGGDIDLYIETQENEYSIVSKRKSALWSDLQNKLGEQKIDIVLNRPCDDQSKLIYSEARKGIILMKKMSKLEDFIEIIEIHKKRLTTALRDTKKMPPITPYTFGNLSEQDAYVLEMLNTRFCKMQDDMGSKIFPKILEVTSMYDKSVTTYIDKLNFLEKDGFLFSAEWWDNLRKLRNGIVHDYDNKHDILSDHTNQLIVKAQELIDYWEELKPKLEVLIAKLPTE